MRTQTFGFHFKAAPTTVYAALLEPKLLPQWRAPDGMTMQVHQYEPWQGGRFRVSLIYQDPAKPGKSGQNVDTYSGHFKVLMPAEKIVEVLSFESKGPDFTGEMTIHTLLTPKDGGTQMIVIHDNLPEAVPADQNEEGWKMSLAKLARLVET